MTQVAEEKKWGGRDPDRWKTEEEFLADAKRYWTRCFYDPRIATGTGKVQGATDLDLNLSDQELVEAVDRLIDSRRATMDYQNVMGLKSFGGLDVLDFGCGVGADAVVMAENGAKVTLCDIVSSNLEVAARQMRARGLTAETFLVGDSYSDLKRLGSFDMVYAGGVLTQIPPQWLKGVVEELKRHLHPGGRFMAMTYTDAQPGPEGPYTKPGFNLKELGELFAPMQLVHHQIFNAGTFQVTVFR